MIKCEINKRENNEFGLSIKTPYEYYYASKDSQVNYVSINFFKKHVWLTIPMIIKPKKVEKSYTDANGKVSHYTDYIQREYGFTTYEDGIHIHYGIQPGCWTRGDPKNSDHSKVFDIPWLCKRSVYTDHMNKDGSVAMRTYPSANGRLQFDMMRSAENLAKPLEFKFQDFDGTKVFASVKETVTTYRRGTSWCSWIGYFLPKLKYRRLNIDFDQETGSKKSSWKGGTLSSSFCIPNDVEVFNAFHNYAYKEGFSNVEVV